MREVNTGLFSDWCPDCNHFRDETCEDLGGETGYLDKNTSAQSSESIYISRAKPKAMRIILNGNLIDEACADTGCEVNCITQSLAKELSAGILKEVREFNLPLKGRALKSVGITWIECMFEEAPIMRQKVMFCVFERILGNVILGRKFLRTTQTLNVYKKRLYDLEYRQESPVHVRSVGAPGEHLECWLDGIRLSSFPDTGAQVNLMSKAFAVTIGWRHNLPGWGQIRSDESIFITFADGSVRQTCGTINVTVAFREPNTCSGPVHIFNNRNTTLVKLATGTFKPGSTIREEFHVLKDLQFDAILGETLLTSVDAYVQYATNFSLARRTDTASWIAPFRIGKRGEGNRKLKVALTEKQVLDDEYQTEQSRYQTRLDTIDACYPFDHATALAGNERFQAKEAHLAWWTANRERLVRHYTAAWYDTNVPKLNA